VTVPPSDFAANTMDFLRSGRAPFDVKFSVDGAVFEAHKLVVAARSDWFAAAIYGHGDGNKGAETTWVEATTPCIAVHDTSPDAFEALLHYIYHDTLPEEMMKEKGDAVMTRALFEAADMLLIERLKKMCANRMCRFINDDTVEAIMDLAKTHSCKELERACRNHLKRRKALAVRR
jgi:speckle-type POZ protein